MLTKLEIHNYKSIYDATIELAPFTLLIGANGTGKSNFIRLLKDLSQGSEKSAYSDDGTSYPIYYYRNGLGKHFCFPNEDQVIKIFDSNGQEFNLRDNILSNATKITESTAFPSGLKSSSFFILDPACAGRGETLVANPRVNEDGSGIVQVLDSLKTGDREDLFFKIESQLGEYVPEIKKISFIPGKDTKKLQVREKHIPHPVPVEMLSEGTKLVLTILTILYQENPPSLVCIEDIDRGLHPRLFQQIVELCNDISRELNIQIIATTHNPYILDEFVGNESAVVIVEKKAGCTTFTTLAERLAQVQDNGEEMPLGAVWYSGLVGGVPKR